MKKIVIGVLILLLGVFLLFYNLDIISYSLYHTVMSWQTLLIAIGAVILFDKKQDTRNAGVILIVVGVLFLLPKVFNMNISGIVVPLLIILAGVYFIVRAVTRKNRPGAVYERRHFDFETQPFVETDFQQEGMLRREYVFTGSKEKLTAGKIKGGDINAVFSGVELDFSQVELSDEVQSVYIKIQSVFSGVIIYVPEEWNLIIQKTGVFGGFTDKRPSKSFTNNSGKSVILELEAIFGGGEIKTYE